MKYTYPTLLLHCATLLLLVSKLQAQCTMTVNAGEDIALCAPVSPVQLHATIDGNYLDFFWSPTTGMTNANTLEPTVSPNQTTSYILSVRNPQYNDNLVINGDFEAGNSGFSSDYTYNPLTLSDQGTYTITPGLIPPYISVSCADHTGGGNFMQIHADLVPNSNAWCQTVPVTPNTDYYFSAWVMPLNHSFTSTLKVNGTQVAALTHTGTNGFCDWNFIGGIWHNTNNTSATICFARSPTYHSHFCIDDISFFPMCAAKDTVKVQVSSVKAVASPALVTLPCEGFEVKLNGQGSSTGAGFVYNWETADGHIVSGENTLNPTIDAAGTYILTVTLEGASGPCTATATVTVKTDTPMQAWILDPAPLDCDRPTCLLISQTAAPGPKAYQWTAGPGGHIVAGANQATATVDQPGIYTLLVTNTNTGCTVEASVSVASNAVPPVVHASAPAYTCVGQQTIKLSGNGSSTGAAFSYHWTTPNGHIVAGKDSLYALADTAGTYILQVTNKNNQCARADTIIIRADTLMPAAGLRPHGSLDCLTDTLRLYAAGISPANALLSWSAAAGGQLVGRTDTSFAVLALPGVYTLTAVNPQSGCSASTTDSIGRDITPPVAALHAPDTLTCTRTELVLRADSSAAGPAFVYHWSTPDGNITSGANTLAPIVNAPGLYTLQVTDTLNHCTASASTEVRIDAGAVAAVAQVSGPLSCLTPAVLLDAGGSSTGPAIVYSWTTPGGGLLSGPAQSVQIPGHYILLVSNNATGCTATATAMVTGDTAPPAASLTASGHLNCHNAAVEIANQGNSDLSLLNHLWTKPDGSTENTGINPALQANTPGIYTLLVTNVQNGCTALAQTEVIGFVSLDTQLFRITPARCFGASEGSIQLAISGGDGAYAYQWSSGQNTPGLANLAAGTYTVTVSDGENCSLTLSASITQPSLLSAAITGAPPSVAGASDGVVNILPAGGTPPYTLLWEDNSAAPERTNLPSGTYTVTITDALGCTTVQTITLANGACNLAAAMTTRDPACSGGTDGIITAAPLGGEAPFLFQWSNDATGATATGLAAGTYSVVITDAAGCQFTASATLNDPSPILLSLDRMTPASCPDSPDGSASVASGGGSGNLSLSWSSGAQGAEANSLPAGTYTVTATDSNSCTATLAVVVPATDTEPPALSGGPVSLPLGPAGIVTLTLQNLSVTVGDNCALADIQIQPAHFDCLDLGVQSAVVTAFDASGNSAQWTIPVTVTDTLAPQLQCPPDVRRCAADNTVQYVAPVATDNCLTLGGHFDLLEGLPSGGDFPVGTTTNRYTFTDASGNIGACAFTVTILMPVTLTLDSLQHDMDNQSIGQIQVSVAGGIPGYAFQWQRDGQTVGTQEDLFGLGAGTYTLMVTDSAGCTAVAGPFVIDNLVGTSQASWTDLVAVYPNPSTGTVYIVLPDALTGTALQFDVFDALGHRVWAQQYAWKKQISLDCSSFADGLYAIWIRTENQHAAYRVVLQR